MESQIENMKEISKIKLVSEIETALGKISRKNCRILLQIKLFQKRSQIL